MVGIVIGFSSKSFQGHWTAGQIGRLQMVPESWMNVALRERGRGFEITQNRKKHQAKIKCSRKSFFFMISFMKFSNESATNGHPNSNAFSFGMFLM
jgi:hypothetical protein